MVRMSEPPERTPPIEHTRQALRAAAVRLLIERGLPLATSDISLTDAAREADVSRATAFRAYQDPVGDQRPRDRFSDDVLCHLAADLSNTDEAQYGSTILAILAVLAELGPVDQLSAAERERALVRVICVGADENYRQLVADQEWGLHTAILGTSVTRPPSPQVHEALTASTAAAARRYRDLYRELAELFQMRLRPGYTYEQFAALAWFLIEGIALRHRYLQSDIATVETPYDDVPRASLFAAGVLGLAREFFDLSGE